MNSTLTSLFGSGNTNYCGRSFLATKSPHRSEHRVVLGVACFLSWLCFSSTVAAQSSTATSWRDGCRLIDSTSLADIAAAESILRASIASGDAPAEAVCGLALVRLRQDDPADALAIISALPTQYSAPDLQSTQALALRVILCAGLSLENSTQAQQAFRNLVRLIVAANSDPVDLRYGAITVGVTVAMLEYDLADSPIPLKDLGIGRECMLNSKVHGVPSAYTAAYAQASDRASELARQFALIAEKGLNAVAEENAARIQALDKSLSDLVKQKELTDEIFRNAREQTQQNTRDRRKLDNQLASIQLKLRQPTPGHPGPPRPAPGPPPHRGLIQVDEYESRTEFETVIRNGEAVRIPVMRQVRRPQYDIDYERDIKYQRVLDDYQRVKREHERHVEVYQNALRSWTEADRDRRQKLDNERAAIAAKRAELIAASDQIKEHRRDTAREFSAQRNAKEQEEFEIELQSIAVAAAQAQEIPKAFRPSNFAVISWLQEKVLLLRNKSVSGLE